MSEREFHPFANKFPMLPESELKELAEDIKINGLNNPIYLYQDKILDGRNRYLACKMVDVKPKMLLFQGDDKKALDFVVSENLKRRHLTTSQRAMIASELANKPEGKPTKEEQKNPTTMSNKEAAETMNVSDRSVKDAKEIKRKSPQKAKQVVEGKKSLARAKREIRKEKGETTDRDEAIKLGEVALNSLKRVKDEFKSEVYKIILDWLHDWHSKNK